MICINELSFLGQIPSWEEVNERMRAFTDLIGAMELVFHDAQVATHSTIYSSELSKGLSVLKWLSSIKKNDRDAIRRLLFAVKNGPFIDDEMQSVCVCRCTSNGMDIASHSVAGAAHLSGYTASLDDAGFMSDSQISVQLCVNGTERLVENFTNPRQLNRYKRVYTPTRKHTPLGWGTEMDLDDMTAQKVLESGILAGRRVYGLHSGRYYAFYDDNAGGFHGFPIEATAVPNSASKELEKTYIG